MDSFWNFWIGNHLNDLPLCYSTYSSVKADSPTVYVKLQSIASNAIINRGEINIMCNLVFPCPCSTTTTKTTVTEYPKTRYTRNA